MDRLTSPQRRAVTDAFKLLRSVNVPPDTFSNLYSQSSQHAEELRIDSASQPRPSPAIQKASYIPCKATYFDEEQCSKQLHRVTRNSYVSALVDHPEGAVIEYPEAGIKNGDSVAHRYTINPTDFTNPSHDIQFSLGDKHGGRDNLHCYLLLNSSTGKPVICKRRSYSCCSTKVCEFFADVPLQRSQTPEKYYVPWTAERELFTKTLALYTSLRERGCSFASDKDFPHAEENNSGSETDDSESAAAKSETCEGRLILKKTEAGRYIIECEHRRKGRRSHLRLTDLHEYDLEYLSALLDNNTSKIKEKEEQAEAGGYGPLVPCKVMIPASAKKQSCPEWHRFRCGRLERGELHRDWKCDVIFDIFVPNEITMAQNQVLIVCRNAHSHPNPAPIKTPTIYAKILKSLLKNLGWRLADTTARRCLLDTSFESGLRSHLGWSHKRNPVLADLHPSLSNSDHVKRIILEMRESYFPNGTEFKGVKALCKQEKASKDPYVRCAEEIVVEGKKIRIVIYTSFKRLYSWDEFEVETWIDGINRSLVICRAFTTSQTAAAHFHLFKRIFAIAEADTGLFVRFRHIHGGGIETIIADNHKGQALGLGLFCVMLCEKLHEYCIDCNELLSALDAYGHLEHFFRSCTVHFKRHIYDMRKTVPPNIIAAMLSLSTTEVISDLDGLFALIRSGGKKPTAWLDDKLISSKFAFPGIYQPASKIPLEIWKASPSTTNGNEQSHRNANRDGVGLTLLAGVMRGEQYDNRAFEGIEKMAETGVQTRDFDANHHNRKRRTIDRKVRSQQRQLHIVDEQIKALQEKMAGLKKSIDTAAERYRKELLRGNTGGPAGRKLKKLREQLKQHWETIDSLHGQSSGKITLDLNGGEQLDDISIHEDETIEVDNDHFAKRLRCSSPRPHPSSAAHTAPSSLPVTNKPAHSMNIQSLQIKQFVPNVAKWYG